MFKINLSTLTAERVAFLPAELVGLDPETLRNLQTALDPVPAHLIGVEYWPAEYVEPATLGAGETLGDEFVLGVDAESKVVRVTRAIRPATPEEIKSTYDAAVARYMAAVQIELDRVAVAHGYDNIVAAISYAEEPAVPRYQQEGQALRAWRSQVWYACERLLAEVTAGTRAQPTEAEVIAALPTAPEPLPREYE